ncbi:iron-sulfur cluster assembly accessory protein [Nostoc sp. FACHB-152]|uniref:HesB/IscA family protein n=1 Tax=unclassified Nostoc TaxID=2593658 RepID=UPI0016823AF0|nr:MULTISPECIES: iron-sulfur cluster assembly accessory protein [unclassified Nostoc]MBD2447933.1 iron-sulfur cluster assembly accessory protein [Nostoc sp. FACHB-152]MBD2468493.1 iron-sulfur cluster assembly accessory protein [Nostoc sp. FACHB-145]
MIQLSQAAASEIKRLKSKQPNALVRLAVKPGGCSDLFYDLSFEETQKTSDRLFEIHGLKILIDDESLNYLHELALDYSEDLMGGGFRFHNPQAVSTCSCGNSFSVSQELVVHS